MACDFCFHRYSLYLFLREIFSDVAKFSKSELLSRITRVTTRPKRKGNRRARPPLPRCSACYSALKWQYTDAAPPRKLPRERRGWRFVVPVEESLCRLNPDYS